jgi:DnaJ like chaperone protein
MNATQVSIIVICALVGYWVVSAVFGNKESSKTTPEPQAIMGNMQPDCFAVLGVLPTASTAEIRDAYKRLMSQYHPDHVAHLGQELRDLAQQKSKEISAAYVQAMQGRAELP